ARHEGRGGRAPGARWGSAAPTGVGDRGAGPPPATPRPAARGDTRGGRRAQRPEAWLSRGVLLLVVRAEGARLDGLPPGLALPVPGHRRLEGGAEGGGGLPAEGGDLAGVERVAPVVSRPIGHGRDEALRLAQEMEHLSREDHVLHLVATADVVDLAVLALADDGDDARRVVQA